MVGTKSMVWSLGRGWHGGHWLVVSRRPTALLVTVLMLASLLLAVPVATRPWTAGAVEPPAGGLVDSAPGVGWTQGNFSVSDDGAAQYSLPLWTPDGHGSVVPPLSLSFHSRAGNGLVGVGWSLSGLSRITWCARTYAQDGFSDAGHFDGTSPLCLDGNRLLPPTGRPLPQQEYNTEKETFSRITGFGTEDGVPDTFRVETRDGKILTYGELNGDLNGKLRAFRLRATGSVDDPGLEQESDTRVTVAWLLRRIEDRNGNAATIDYASSEGGPADPWSVQSLPQSISYGPGRFVRFNYEDRPDVIDSFSGGVHVRTTARVNLIEMGGTTAEGRTELLRQYQLSYLPVQSSSITGRSLLNRIVECDGANVCKQPLDFNWTMGSYDFQEVEVDGGGFDNGHREWVNLMVGDPNGDGRGDLVYRALPPPAPGVYPHQVKFGTDGGFTDPVALSQEFFMPKMVDVDVNGRTDVIGPSLFLADSSGFFVDEGPIKDYIADLDGDGLPDTIGGIGEHPDMRWMYRLNTGGPGTERFQPRVTTDIPESLFRGTHGVDIDGDGRAEMIGQPTTPPGGTCHGVGWFGWGLNTLGGTEVGSVNIRGCAWMGTHFGDVNGDGLADAITVHPEFPNTDDGSNGGSVDVQLNSGRGFGRVVPNPQGFVAPTEIATAALFNDRGVRVADFNNDGHDDMMFFRRGTPTGPNDPARGVQLYVWKHSGFERAPVSEEIGDYRSLPTDDSDLWDWNHTQPLDIDGDSVLDLVKMEPLTERIRLFKRQGGVPDRLVGIGNSAFGPRIDIGYTTLADRAVHTPGECVSVQTCLTKGGSVVAWHQFENFVDTRETPRDRFDHTYKAARSDLQGRGWLGFAEHTVTRHWTGEVTVSEFDNITQDDGATKVYPFAGRPKKVTTTVRDSPTGREHRTTVVNAPVLRRHARGAYTVEMPKVTVTEQERAVGAAAWDTLRTNTTDTVYDGFGNADLVVSTTTDGQKVTSDPVFRNDTTAWLIGLVTGQVTTGEVGIGCEAVRDKDKTCQVRESAFEYDGNGNPTVTVIEPNRPELKLTTTTMYREHGNVESVTTTDNAGQARKTTFEYTGPFQLYPTGIINALDHKIQIDTELGLGVPLSTSGPNARQKTTNRYDRFGRLRETNRSDGSFERINQSVVPNGGRQRTETAVSGGEASAVEVDQLGRERKREVKTFNGTTATSETTYDRLGRVHLVSRPALPDQPPQLTITEYDNRGRVTSVTAPDNVRVRHEYLNRETHTYDGKDIHRFTVTNVDGDIESSFQDDPNSANWLHTQYEYGPFGHTNKVVAPDGTAQEMRYNVLGQRERIEDPSSGVTTTKYTAFGEVAIETDAENNTTEFRYDELGRVRKKTTPEGDTTWNYDTAPNGIGMVVSARSADGVGIDYRYTPQSKPSTTTWSIGSASFQVSHDYDTLGRPSTMTYPAVPGTTDRLKIAYVYNQHGYLAQIKDAVTGLDPCTNEDRTAGLCYWTAEAHEADGQLKTERLGNGVVTEHTYKPQTGLLERITSTGPNGTRVGEISYDYDNNRNVKERNNVVDQRHDTFHHDTLNRLQLWSVRTSPTQPPAVRDEYAYDSMGILETEVQRRQGRPDEFISYNHDGREGAPPHAMTTRNETTYTYDRAGRQETGDGRTITYNSDNLPQAITWGSNQRTEFDYDPTGARFRKVDNNQTVFTIPGIFELQNPAGTGNAQVHSTHYIATGGRTVAQVTRVQNQPNGPITGSRLWYLHQDLLGSTYLITRPGGLEPDEADDSWLRNLIYDPFGQRLDTNFQPLEPIRRGKARTGYTGHEHDDELALINMNGRIYDPKARRFLTPDPVVPDPLSSQSLNRYTYVQNNPTTRTDPTGYIDCNYGGDEFGCLNGMLANDAYQVMSVSPADALEEMAASDPELNPDLIDSAAAIRADEATRADDDVAHSQSGEIIVMEGPGLAKPMFQESTESFALWLWENRVDIVLETTNFALEMLSTPLGGGNADGDFDGPNTRVPYWESALAAVPFGLGRAERALAQGASKAGRIAKLADDVPEAPVSVYHGSINDATTIRAKGLDPSRTPTWVSRDKNAAQDAIGSRRIDAMKDPGLIEARIPRAEFERVMLPNERVYYGWGSDGPATTEIVLRTPTQVELFNRYMIGGR